MTEFEFEVERIAKTGDDVPFTMVRIAVPKANTTNDKYAGTFRIEDEDMAEGTLLVKHSLRKAVPAYENAHKDGELVPVYVFADGVAVPYTTMQKRRFEERKENK
jgi:hypothetical protein